MLLKQTVNKGAGKSSPLQVLADCGLVVFSLVVLGLYSSWNRPIWLDEYLFFAFGNMSFPDVLEAIHRTATEINHGQTGFYILTDWTLLQIFGASSVALRVPSFLAGGLLLFASVLVLRFRGFGRVWQYLMVAFLACQQYLMYFVGEARPYMLLAATAVAALAYYQLNPSRRRTWIGWFLIVAGIWTGVLNHPYFPLMLGIALVVSIWTGWRSGWIEKSWRSLLSFLDPFVLASSAAVYVVVGALTWLPGRPDFGYDPFSNMGSLEIVIRAFWRDHLGLLWAYRPWALAFLVLIAVVLLVGNLDLVRDVAAPVALSVLAIGGSFAVSVASYLSSYWILQRQWIAGIALFAVGTVWFLAELYRAVSGHIKILAALPALALSVVALVGVRDVWQAQTERLRSYSQKQAELHLEQRSMEQMEAEGAEWPYMANVNILRGGPVWPVFTDWYSRQAGMREE